MDGAREEHRITSPALPLLLAPCRREPWGGEKEEEGERALAKVDDGDGGGIKVGANLPLAHSFVCGRRASSMRGRTVDTIRHHQARLRRRREYAIARPQSPHLPYPHLQSAGLVCMIPRPESALPPSPATALLLAWLASTRLICCASCCSLTLGMCNYYSLSAIHHLSESEANIRSSGVGSDGHSSPESLKR